MKTKYLLLQATLFMMVFTLTMFGQNMNDMKTKNGMNMHNMKMHDMKGMMGKPTTDAIVDGVHMKVWLMTQKQHKKLMDKKMIKMKNKDMKGMNHDGNDMDKEMKDAMMAGSHHIMLDITDVTGGKEISDASAKVMIVSPNKKNSTVDLKSMMNHFGAALTLDEKGKYQITVSIIVNGNSKTTQFQYKVK